MQRWFFLEDTKKRTKVKRLSPKKMSGEAAIVPKTPDVLTQSWVFTVSAPDVKPGETVFITGSIPELGLWDYSKVVLLENQPGTPLWSVTLTIPNTCDVLYRYGICTNFIPNTSESNQIVIKCWETNISPRVLKETMLHPFVDTFGIYNNMQPDVTRGWLTSQTLLQFKFNNNPLKLRSKVSGRILNIKVTPVKLSFGTNETHIDESSLSTDTTDIEVLSGVSVEVATLNNDPDLCKLQPQQQFGREYKSNDILLVNILAPNITNLAYLVDFYSYSSRASTEDAPFHVGYTYVLPNMFKPSEGSLQLPVTCNVKHRPLGTVNIEYLIIYPMAEPLCNLEVSYVKHWNPRWTGLEVGHRGLGASFKNKEGNSIRENTIASLKKAAASGADLLEFDVQLSKDMIPVIYHDYYVCISMKRKKEVDFSEMLELPVKDLTLEHLQKLKVKQYQPPQR